MRERVMKMPGGAKHHLAFSLSERSIDALQILSVGLDV